MRSLAAETALRWLGAAALVVVGGVHLQQYVSFMSDVPTIGVLFLLNAAGAAAAAAALLLPDRPLRLVGALGGAGVAAGALVSIVIAFAGGIFGYQETNLRSAVAVAIVSETVSVLALGGYLVTVLSARIATRGAAESRESFS